jgi:hypothetical protein
LWTISGEVQGSYFENPQQVLSSGSSFKPSQYPKEKREQAVERLVMGGATIHPLCQVATSREGCQVLPNFGIMLKEIRPVHAHQASSPTFKRLDSNVRQQLEVCSEAFAASLGSLCHPAKLPVILCVERDEAIPLPEILTTQHDCLCCEWRQFALVFLESQPLA